MVGCRSTIGYTRWQASRAGRGVASGHPRRHRGVVRTRLAERHPRGRGGGDSPVERGVPSGAGHGRRRGGRGTFRSRTHSGLARRFPRRFLPGTMAMDSGGCAARCAGRCHRTAGIVELARREGAVTNQMNNADRQQLEAAGWVYCFTCQGWYDDTYCWLEDHSLHCGHWLKPSVDAWAPGSSMVLVCKEVLA